MKNYSFFLAFTILSNILFAQQDTTWLSDGWQKVDKSDASFYRLPPIAKEGGFFITDYFLSGQKQMEAFSKSNTEDIFQGTVTWFSKEGKISQKSNYVNGTMEGVVESFLPDGSKTEAEYRNNFIYNGKIIFDYKDYFALIEAKDGFTLYQKFYTSSTSKAGFEFFFENNQVVKQISYGNQGELIGECSFKNDYTPVEGIIADYFYSPLTVRTITVYKNGEIEKMTSYHKSGEIRESQIKSNSETVTNYYDSLGNNLGVLIEKTGDNNYYFQQNGKQVIFDYNPNQESKVISITEFVEGKKVKVTYFGILGDPSQIETYDGNDYIKLTENFNALGNPISKLVYQDGYPMDGTEVVENKTTVYKNGKIIEEKELYKNGKLFKTTEFGKSTFYNKNETVLGILLYDNREGEFQNLYPMNGDLFTLADDQLYTKETYANGFLKEASNYNFNFKDENRLSKTTLYGKEGSLEKGITYFTNGNKKSEMIYNNYYPVSSLFFDEKGKQLSAFSYEPMNGTEYKYFDDTDQIETIKKYKNDSLQYEKSFTRVYGSQSYEPTYAVATEIDYNNEGKFYEANKLLYTTTYKNGKPYQGKAIVFDSYIGKLVENYTEGSKDGEQLYYEYGSLKLIRKENFVKGVQQGTTEIYVDEKINQKIPFQNGSIEGDVEYFDADGNKISTLFYKEGIPQNGIEMQIDSYTMDVRKTIYSKGEIIETQYTSNNMLLEKQQLQKEGEFFTTKYYDSGKQKFTYSIKDGLLHGKVIYFSEVGKKLWEANLQNGVLESGELWLSNTSYYGDDPSDFYKIFATKSEVTLLGITAPDKVLYEVKEKSFIADRKSMIFTLLSINYLAPGSLYNNIEYVSDPYSTQAITYPPPIAVEQVKE